MVKFKGVEKLKHQRLFVFSAFSLISVVIIRTIQLMFLTDNKTGFFITGLEGIGTALTVLAVLLIVLSGMMIFLGKKEKIDPVPTPSYLVGGTAILAGVAHIIEPLLGTEGLISVPQILLTLRLLLLPIAGAVFIYFGLSIILEKNPHFGLSVFLVLCLVIRLMTSFIGLTGMSNISENMFDVLMLVSTLIFILFFSKAICGLSRSTGYRRLIAVGVTAVLFTAASSLPTIIVSVIMGVNLSHTPIDSPITGIFTALFIACYLINICRKNKPV